MSVRNETRKNMKPSVNITLHFLKVRSIPRIIQAWWQKNFNLKYNTREVLLYQVEEVPEENESWHKGPF